MSVTDQTEMTFVWLGPGDRLPAFRGRTVNRPVFDFDAIAGRYQVFAFFMSGEDPLGRSAVDAIARHRERFDDQFASAMAVTVDRRDEARLRDQETLPGVRFLWDFDCKISRACGALPEQDQDGALRRVRRFWLVVDPTRHVLARIPFSADDPEHKAVFDLLDGLPPPAAYAGAEMPTPVLMVPNVFEPAFCATLIDLYERHGGEESGVVRDNKGVLDPSFKRRKDYLITDPVMIESAIRRVTRRVGPELERLLFFKTHMFERQIVACYASEDGGHFQPHRDNSFGLTMHRKYAVSINLNDGFEGGGVVFPEYSARAHKAPAGWALIFPCAILHAVQPVTVGRRYAYLPFLYDEPAAIQRQEMIARYGGLEVIEA
jgi:peroxiredoxin